VENLPDEENEPLRSLIGDNDPGGLSAVAEELHRRYHRLIYYFLRIFGLPDDQLEDLFNQIFLKIIKGLGNIKHSKNLKSRVVTITKNEIFSFFNKRDREANVLQTGELNESQMVNRQKFSKIDSPERQIYDKQLMSAFEDGVALLDRDIAEPFLMRYRDNLRWKEIGAALQINEDTARKRSERARKIIQRYLNRRLGKRHST
jgi:RNA polymerase sigma-70 factor (ECF subfamily)